MKNILNLLSVIALLFCCANTKAQIIAPDSIGLGSSINFNSAKPAVTYHWDFNNVNVIQPPSPTTLVASGFNIPSWSCFMKDGPNYYLFVSNYNTGNIIRLNYGTSLYSTPVTTNLGTLGGTDVNTECMDLAKDSLTGDWYGLLVNNSQLIVLSFGSSLNNTPTFSVTTYPQLRWPHQITIKRWHGNWHAFVANRDAGISRFDFGSALTNPPTVTNIPNVGGVADPCNFSLFEQSGNWYMLITNLLNRTISRYSFGPNLLNNAPTGTILPSSAGTLRLPRSVFILNDCHNNLIAYVLNETGNLIRLNFAGDITNLPVFTDMGPTGLNSIASGAACAYADSFFILLTDFRAGTVSKLSPFNFNPPTSLQYFNGLLPRTLTTTGPQDVSLFLDMGRPSGPSVGCKRVNVVDESPITGVHTLCEGGTTTLSNIITGGIWTATPSTVVTIHPTTGVVSALSAGTATITYSAPGGFTATFTMTINPLAPIAGNTPLCEGAGIMLTNPETGGTWASGSPGMATVNAGGVVTGVANGTSVVSYTTTGGCLSTVVVTVLPTPPISVPTMLCIGSTGTGTSTTIGGLWSSSNLAVATIDPTTGLITAVTAGTTTITYNTGAGCPAIGVVSVVAVPPISGNSVLCMGQSITLSCSIPGGVWSSSNTSAVTINAATGSLTGIGVGTSTISYTIALGCSSTTIVTVSTATAAIAGDSEVCVGAATTLTNAISGGTWTSSNTSIATISSSSGYLTGIAVGTVNITYHISTSCFVTRTMSVINAPATAITGPTRVCIGSSVTLSNAISGGTWISGNVSRATVNAVTGTVSGVSGGAVTITYYTNSTCYRTHSMTVNALPASIGGSAVVCEGSTTTLTNSTPGGTWINDGSFCIIGNTTGIVTGVVAGIGTVFYVVASTGCATTKAVTVNTTPSAIAGAGSICVGAMSTLTSTPAGGTWVSSVIPKASIGMSNGVLTGAAAGTTMISYNIAGGCRATTVVTVLAAPIALTGTNSLCMGSTTTLTSGNAGLTWSSTNNAVATVATATATTGIVTGVSVGTAEISYTAGSGCAAKIVVSVSASGAAITGPDVVCIGGTIPLVNIGGTWSSSNTARATVNTIGLVTGVSAGSVTITFRQSATCYVTKIVTVNTSPADAITGPSMVCQGTDIILAHPVAGGTWSSSLPYRASVDAVSGVVRGISAGAVTISYQTQPGCFRTYVVTVAGYVFPISGTYVVCEGKTTTLSSALTGGVWSSGTPAVATINPASGLVTGVSGGVSTITYTISSTGCNTIKDFTVNPNPSVVVGPSSMCIGESVSYTGSPAGGSWATSAGIITTINATTGSATGIRAGNAFISYTLPTGCVNRTASAVTVNPLPYAITGNALFAYGATRTFTSLTTSGAVWSGSAPVIATISPTGLVTAGSVDGNTTISYTFTSTGCAVTKEVTVNATGTRFAASSSDNLGMEIKVYPSPTNGVITIESAVAGNLSVYSIDGKTIGTYRIGDNVVTINLPDYITSGVYMCKFEYENGSVKIFRILCSK